MTGEERQAYIRRVVDAAPSLSSEDADRIRALLPMGSRRSAEHAIAARPQRSAARTAAA